MERRPRPTCWNKALDLLSRRDHFAAELRAKLRQRGYGADELEATLERLAEQGLIDDRRLALQFVAHRRVRSAVSRRRLAAELARRGVEASLIEEATAAIGDDEDLEAARQAAARFATKKQDPDHKRRRAALARHLERKGFGSRAILAVLDDQADPESAADPVGESEESFP